MHTPRIEAKERSIRFTEGRNGVDSDVVCRVVMGAIYAMIVDLTLDAAVVVMNVR